MQYFVQIHTWLLKIEFQAWCPIILLKFESFDFVNSHCFQDQVEIWRWQKISFNFPSELVPEGRILGSYAAMLVQKQSLKRAQEWFRLMYIKVLFCEINSGKDVVSELIDLFFLLPLDPRISSRICFSACLPFTCFSNSCFLDSQSRMKVLKIPKQMRMNI